MSAFTKSNPREWVRNSKGTTKGLQINPQIPKNLIMLAKRKIKLGRLVGDVTLQVAKTTIKNEVQ